MRSFPTISRQMASLVLLAVEPLRVVKTPPREVCDFQEQAVSPSRFATLRRSSSQRVGGEAGHQLLDAAVGVLAVRG